MKRASLLYLFLQVFGIIVSGCCYGQLQKPPTIQWQRSLGGSNEDYAYWIEQTRDSGYVIAGSGSSKDGDLITGDSAHCWVIKLKPSGAIEWKRSLAGSPSETGTAIQQTLDGGYIMTGGTHPAENNGTDNHGLFDYWVVKLNDTGAIEWQKAFGGSEDEFASSIQQTKDGGYIIAGTSWSEDGDVTINRGSYDWWIVKLNDTGAIEWQKSLGGSSRDDLHSIKQTADGGYIAAGSSNNGDGDVILKYGYPFFDCWIVKFSDTGSVEWQTSLGGSLDDIAYAIDQTTDGGYIIAGESKSNDGDVTGHHGMFDFWAAKLDHTGAIQWQRSVGGSEDERAVAISQTKDNGYVLAGESHSIDGDVTGHFGDSFCEDYWVVRLNDTGAVVWERSLGGSMYEHANCVQATFDGGYIVAGSATSIDGDVQGHHGDQYTRDMWIVKLGPDPKSSVPSPTQIDEGVSIITPNPASNHISLTIDASVSLYSLMGERIFSGETHSGERIELPYLASGVYIAKIVHGGVTKMEKLIIR